MEQPAGSGDFDSTVRGRTTRWTNLTDRVVLDQDIGEIRRSSGDVEHAPATQDRIGHAMVSSKPPYHRTGAREERAMPSVVLKRNEAVLEIILNRPEVLNA